jgi:hypothetical protein
MRCAYEGVYQFDHRKRCKQHGENGMAEQTSISAADHRAIGPQSLSNANDSARLNFARLKIALPRHPIDGRASRLRRCCRPRWSRDFTVPWGVPMMSAISR